MAGTVSADGRLRFYVSAPPDVVLEHIRSTTGADGRLFTLADWVSKEDVLSLVGGHEFRLRMRMLRPTQQKFLGMRLGQNSWAPLFYGEVNSLGATSLIVGQFRVHAVVRWFMRLWLAIVAAAAIVGVIGLASGDLTYIMMVGVSTLMFAFGVILPRIGERIGRYDEQQLLAFLNDLSTMKPEQFAPTRP